MKNKLFGIVLAVIVVLNVFGWTWYSLRRSQSDHLAQEKHEAKLKAIAVNWTNNGVYTSREQCIKLLQDGDDAIKNGTLPKEEIDYLLKTVKDPLKGSTAPGYVHYVAAYDLSHLKSFAAGDKQKILKTCLSLLSSADPLDKRAAVVVAKSQHSKEAVPTALTMLHGPNEPNQKLAKLYLDELGFRPSG